MSKKQKLLDRLLSRPKNFTFDELVTLLGYYGYEVDNKGKTSGSRVKFVGKSGDTILKIHKPHGSKALLDYQIAEIIKLLEEQNGK